jgi:hypothetical protein
MANFFNKFLLDIKCIKNFYFLIINFFFNVLSNIFVRDCKDYSFFLDNFSKNKFVDNLYKNIFSKNIAMDIF